MKKPTLLCRILCCYFAFYLALPASSLAQLTLSQPSFPTTNTVRLTLTGTTNNTAYLIFFTPTLLPDINQWARYFTGTVNQTVFDLSRPTNANAFFRASDVPNPIPTVATPVCTPGGGSYGAPTNVTITCATDGAATYYTTNGSTPTTLGNFVYNGDSVYIPCSLTLKAKAFKFGYNDSAVATNTYLINCAPVVSAGPQQIISSSPATLQGYVTDDGVAGGGTRFTNWSKISGPGNVTFGNASQTNTTAAFTNNGIYVLQLRASDGQYTNSSQVTIALNPTLSVSLTAPVDGSSYTVPTNILLQATAACTSGSVTQVAFYAGSTLIGAATNEPYSFEWRSVPAGSHALTAVASSTDVNNLSLASYPSNITVNWPTNVGQLTASINDLQIPVAGLPITVNRVYDTRYGTNGFFGFNWKLDYERIKIQKSGSLADGWVGTRNGFVHCIKESGEHLVTVSLSENEQYYFVPKFAFDLSGSPCINAASPPNCYNFYETHLEFTPVGLGQLSVATPAATVGMDDGLSGWTVPLTAVYFDDFGDPISAYDPDFSEFTFTTPDGTRYGFNSDGTLASKTDRNGNALTYFANGIQHSSGQQVVFTLDGNNRITEIYDPIALNTSGSPALTYAYDGNGNLTNVARLVQRSPGVYENTAYAYTNATYTHHLTKITDPRSVAIQRNEFDSSGRLLRQYDAAGYVTSYSYDLNNHRQTITDRLTNSTTQNFTLSGQVSSVQDAQGGVTQFAYDDRGRKIAETDALGQTTTYAYDSNDQLTGVTNEVGAASSATYNQFGQVLVAIDARGNGTTNDYDANGNLTAVTNALGVVTRYGYDAQGNRIAETNAFGATIQTVTLNQYNEFGYLTNLIDALSHTTSFTYDLNGNRLAQTTTRTTSNGTQTLTTTQTYDAANRVTRTVEPDGFTNRIAFNNIGKQAQTIDKLGRTNSFSYDARGFLTNTTYADGLYETVAYDAEGRRTQSVDRGGRATTYSYDGLGRLVRTTFADGSYTGSGYNAAGQLTATVQGPVPPGGMNFPPPEFQTDYTYDAAGRRILVTDALFQDTRFAYDANGNQTTVVDALSHTNNYGYDALNRRTQIIFPDGTTESTGYDALDRRIAVTNQAGVVTRFGYDALGRLKAVTNAFGSSVQMVTRYAYDEVGNQTNQVDALNRTNLFEYDAVGRRTKQILPGNQAQTFGYDAVGNLIRQTNFNSVILTNAYDALNRLTNKASAGGYKISFAYSATGQRTNMVDASGTNTYTYDSRDRLLTKATPQGTLTYTYDAYGNQATLQSSTTNGTKLTYSYDDLNRLTNVVDRFTNNTFYNFDAVGNLQTYRYQNNVTNSYAYNALNRLTNISVTAASGTLASFAYKVAAAGNRTNLTESLNSVNRTNTWAYDALYRLTNEVIGASSGPTGSITNKYDAVGNRTNRASSVAGVSSVTNGFNNNDQLTTDVYDSNGNTRTNGSNTYLYDVENRLTNAVVGGTNLTNIYDGDGNRVKKIVGTTTNFYLIDNRNPTGYPQVLEELSTVATPDRLYTYGLDLISQRQSGGTTSFYGYDGNGNVRFLTATNATISDTYAYDAFGIGITNTGTTPNNYRYTGEQYDPNLGFYYLRARYMNPNTGRFWTKDSFEGSIFDPPSLHKYTYCANNPVNCTDPSGHENIISVSFASFVTATLTTINYGRLVLVTTRARAIATLVSGIAAFNDKIRATFLNGVAEKIVLETDLLVVRVIDKIGGVTAGSTTASSIGSSYFTTTTITSSAQAQRLLALDPNFNRANFIVSAIIPRGTTIYQGIAAPLKGNPGGAVQIFVEDISEISFFGIKSLPAQ